MTKRAHSKTQWQQDVRIAKQLCYPKVVIKLLKEEPDPIKRTKILWEARNGTFDK